MDIVHIVQIRPRQNVSPRLWCLALALTHLVPTPAGPGPLLPPFSGLWCFLCFLWRQVDFEAPVPYSALLNLWAMLDKLKLVAIRGIKHRGLHRFFDRGDARRLHPEHVVRIAAILEALDRPDALSLLALPIYRLHPLKGDRKGLWSVRVSGNWRLVFRFDRGDAFDLDLMDYH